MRRRDIIAVSDIGASMAFNQAVKPILDRLDAPMTGMDDVRAMASFQAKVRAILDDIKPDGPDKLWRMARRHELTKAESAHQWKCRMLDLNPETTPPIALGGMTAMNVDGWKLAVALPAPDPLGSDLTPITQIVLIDAKGEAKVHGSKAPELIGPQSTWRFTVHADPKTWARNFALQRLEHVHRARKARRDADIPPTWHGCPPSALAIGKIDKIDWPFAEEITAGEGIDAKALYRLIRRPTPRVHTYARAA